MSILLGKSHVDLSAPLCPMGSHWGEQPAPDGSGGHSRGVAVDQGFRTAEGTFMQNLRTLGSHFHPSPLGGRFRGCPLPDPLEDRYPGSLRCLEELRNYYRKYVSISYAFV